MRISASKSAVVLSFSLSFENNDDTISPTKPKSNEGDFFEEAACDFSFCADFVL